jgi:ubiquitin C-terminal hydrolase
MEAYDPAAAERGAGLHNTGVICYFNSFLQLLLGCTAFTAAARREKKYMAMTRAGSALDEFLASARPDSARVLHALVAELAARRPGVRFGTGQESASEALRLMLDMLEPPLSGGGTENGENGYNTPLALASSRSPITRLFLSRTRCITRCGACGGEAPEQVDYAVHLELFHFDRLPRPPRVPEEFAEALRVCRSETDGDRLCEKCGRRAKAMRMYRLTMAPEILVCLFNLYDGIGGGAHRARYFPEQFDLPARAGGVLRYRLVGQSEHSGSLSGGHYWARGLRAGGQVLSFDDQRVEPSRFAPTPNTYMIAYHFAGRFGAGGQ